MKLVAILGSARRGGNTETLVRAALEGAGAPGAAVYALAGMEIAGCVGCGGCREDGSEGCVVDDEMQGLYEELKSSDAVVLGSPVYYGEVTGQMKCFMDRWYALRDGERNPRIGAGKKVLFILVQGAPDPGRYGAVIKRLGKVMEAYGMEPDFLVAANLEAKGSAAADTALMESARAAGRRLAGR